MISTAFMHNAPCRAVFPTLKSEEDGRVEDLDESLNDGKELDLETEPLWVVSRRGLMWHFEAMVGTPRGLPVRSRGTSRACPHKIS